MKLNRIISSALVLVMLLTSILTVLPISSMAATPYQNAVAVEMGVADEEKNTKSALKEMLDKQFKNNYSTASEMLRAELADGSLDKVSAAGYNLYVNRYSGFVYYENTRTGQILTSNPIDPYYRNSKLDDKVMSQIELAYTDVSNFSATTTPYNSVAELRQGFALKVSEISRYDGSRGISVQYTLGVNSSDFRVPAYILAEDFVEHIAKPMFDNLAEIMLEYCGEGEIEYNLNNKPEILNGVRYVNVSSELDALATYARKFWDVRSAEYKELYSYIDCAKTIFSKYDYIDPKNLASDHVLLQTVPALRDGKIVYRMVAAESTEDLTTYRLVNDAVTKLLEELYTKDEARADQSKTGYESNILNSASFLISINYYLDRNGELYYEVPMSAPYFVNNNPNYSIKSLEVLKYFGSGDTTDDGYIFFPDGSGSIVEFEKIKGLQTSYSTSMYGNDYGYATLISTNAHLEPTVLPVYGIVNEVNANALTAEKTGESTITNGFFAVIERGSALSNVTFATVGSNHKYASVYASFNPHPMDRYDLSTSVPGAVNLGYYYVVSESVYEEEYRVKITMLSDEKAATSFDKYVPTYIGMASCYRDYLKTAGVIDKLAAEETSKDIPLYIEVLGAMDVTQKILSFPWVVSTPLTTFKQVETMYSELAGDGVKNINFRLTGFANGGMSATYPVKVTWENSVGGADGAKELIEAASSVNASDKTANFGLYPDFDFLYIHNEEMFDGISYLGTTAIMVDNRYASKQSFNAVLQLYETMLAVVISPDQYSELYDKFAKEYSAYNFTGLSVATLGSELNSNFDKENPIHREESLKAVKKVFNKMSDDYSLMTDVGNAYALKYADHILNAPVDSSHYKYSSYTVPFYGMVLHGYVSYAGSPLNYSGFPEYNILRSIENGATLQYILCYENTNYLKDDENLSKYYGVDYKNWREIIVEQYKVINDAIGDLQDNMISAHTTIIGERVIPRSETIANYNKLISEYILASSTQFEAEIAKEAEALRNNPAEAQKYNGLYADIDTKSLVFVILDMLEFSIEEAQALVLTVDEAAVFGIETQADTNLYDAINYIVDELNNDFKSDYPEKSTALRIDLSSANVRYTSQYDFATDSKATDTSYDNTTYTCDNNNIVMVTYLDEETGEKTIFFINYNNYDVKIRLDASMHKGLEGKLDKLGYMTLEASSFIKIQ